MVERGAAGSAGYSAQEDLQMLCRARQTCVERSDETAWTLS